MNFCRNYNKTMNRLDKIINDLCKISELGYTDCRNNVKEISVILGTINIILGLFIVIMFGIVVSFVISFKKLNNLTISKCDLDKEEK